MKNCCRNIKILLTSLRELNYNSYIVTGTPYLMGNIFICWCKNTLQNPASKYCISFLFGEILKIHHTFNFNITHLIYLLYLFVVVVALFMKITMKCKLCDLHTLRNNILILTMYAVYITFSTKVKYQSKSYESKVCLPNVFHFFLLFFC